MSKMKLRFFTVADYQEEEIWLREQHKNGLRFSKFIPPCFFLFEPCTPEDVIYRLDYKNEKQSSDYLQLFSDYGWEYLDSFGGWFYFRKPASEIQVENDGEIFSDPASKADMIRHIIKTRMLPLLAIFLCCVIPGWINSFRGDLGAEGTFFTILFSALLVLYLYLLIHCGRKLKKRKARYELK